MKDEILITEFELRLLGEVLWKFLIKKLNRKLNRLFYLNTKKDLREVEKITFCFENYPVPEFKYQGKTTTVSQYINQKPTTQAVWLAVDKTYWIVFTVIWKRISISSVNKLLNFLLHELVHHACFIFGWENNDGSKDFEEILEFIGAPSNLGQQRHKYINFAQEILFHQICDILNLDYSENNWGEIH